MFDSFRAMQASTRARVGFAVLTLALAASCAPEAGKPKGPPQGAFPVSDYFAPSGAMGDGELPEHLSIDDNQSCKERPDAARGHCYRFVYTAGELLWAGLYFQNPANNWGQALGLPLPAGLTRVSFQAAVDGGPELVKFVVGGIGVPRDPAEAAMYPNDDRFKVESEHTLNSEFQRLEIALPVAAENGAPIDRLIGAFAWFLNHPAGTLPAEAPIKTLYLDDLVYE